MTKLVFFYPNLQHWPQITLLEFPYCRCVVSCILFDQVVEGGGGEKRERGKRKGRGEGERRGKGKEGLSVRGGRGRGG